MTYFGISNLDHINEPFINDIQLFPCIEESILLENIKSNKIYDIPSTEPSNLPEYDLHPILFQHRPNPIIAKIWRNEIQAGDIITNRGSKKFLSYNCDRVDVEKQWISMGKDEHEKYIFLMQPKQIYSNENLSHEQAIIGFQAPSVVFEKNSKSYTIYKYIKRFNYDLQCFEHYTGEIDGFIKAQANDEQKVTYTAVEFKCFKNPPTHELDVNSLWDTVKISTILQCMLTDIDKVICGFRNGFSMTLKLYDISTLINGVEHRVNQALERMQVNTAKVVNDFKGT